MSENVHFEGDAQKRPKKERKRHPRIFSTFNLRKKLRGPRLLWAPLIIIFIRFSINPGNPNSIFNVPICTHLDEKWGENIYLGFP